tara:strand:+ start:109 stop:327 length:219 start_codon:yes stop_codon:yes gene_type:complete
MTFPRYTTYEYKGYTYVGDYDQDPDDGTRKMWHQMTSPTGEIFHLDNTWGPRVVPSHQDFKNVVEQWIKWSS